MRILGLSQDEFNINEPYNNSIFVFYCQCLQLVRSIYASHNLKIKFTLHDQQYHNLELLLNFIPNQILPFEKHPFIKL